MKTLRATGLAAALCAIGMANAETGTVTVIAQAPLADTNWSQTLIVPQYNNPLFHLDSVEVTFHGSVLGTMKFENRNSNSRPYSATVAYSLGLTSPTGAQLLTIQPTTPTVSGILPGYDGTLDYAGTSGITYPDTSADASGTTTFTSDADLATFIGSGNVSFPVNASAKSTVTATGNFDKVITNKASADIQVSYHYSYTPASVGDRVWLDSNNNGVQDAGEGNVAGVTVNLLDGTGKVVGTTTTDANGNYLFSGLVPGNYQVQFVAPAGTSFTSLKSGTSTDLDSDAGNGGLTDTFTLHSGEARTDLDAGLVGLQSVGDFVWLDSNANGVQDAGELGLAGVNVTLYDSKGNVVGTQTTDGNGAYLFTGLLPGDYKVKFDDVTSYYRSPVLAGSDTNKDSDATADGTTATFTLNPGDNRRDIDAGYYGLFNLGDRVWFDANANGIQDDGERGISGVTVTLLDGNGNTITSQTTDNNGNYLFTSLTPGNYQVKFTKPTGYQFTGAHAGSDVSLDSDVDGSGVTQVIALTADNLNVDAGLYGSLCLGDRVWNDCDRDGLQDSNEPGVPGVAVHLLDKNGNVIADTVTNSTGYYKFTNLAPGDYQVDFDAPAGYGFTKQFANSNYKQYDSNADVTTGIAQVTLSATDLTIDAGLIGALKIGDTVWCDSDGDGIYEPNEGEKGIKNVRVTLYDSKYNVIATTTTDANGHYLFMGLNPGTYTVLVNANDIPSTYKQTYDLDGLTTKNYATGKLVAGSDNLDFDFGYKPGTSGSSCNHTWWGCNPNKWNCDNVWVGGKCQPRTTVCNWFTKNDCGDKSICVYQRLCAAKLNVGNGCNQGTVYTCGKTTCSVKDAIKKCDDWMAKYPVGCKVSSNSSAWAGICDYFSILDKYCGAK